MSACLFGTAYNSFVPGWWESLKTLNIQPDAIVFIYDSQNAEYAIAQVPEMYKKITKTVLLDGEYWEYRQAMHTELDTDWIASCGIDDRMLPGAFDELAKADAEGCDIYIDKMQVKDSGQILEGRWNPQQMPDQISCPGSATLKKSLFNKTKGITKGAIFDDWELYIRCVAAGAKPYHANTVRIIHDLGYDHVTLSGVNRVSTNDSIGREHIARVRQELGL
jgi:hypothetical protein